jgi:hypothetical protein
MKRLLLSMLGLTLVAAPFALIGAGVSASSTGPGKQVSYNGFTFSYELATTVLPSTVPAKQQTPNLPDWETNPQYVKFTFPDMARSGLDAAISILPVLSSYVTLDPNDPHATDPWLNRVVALQDILLNKPTWPKPAWLSGSSPYSAPYLPPINAATIFIGKQRYIDFKSGSAVRSLIQITQQPNPIPSDEVVYSFQGLTGDGKYYVAATFPAFLTGPHPTSTGSSNPNWINDYNQGVLRQIDQARNSDFLPDLDTLDRMMASLQVGPVTPAPLPRTGLPYSDAALPVDALPLLSVLAGLLLLSGGLFLQLTRRPK